MRRLAILALAAVLAGCPAAPTGPRPKATKRPIATNVPPTPGNPVPGPGGGLISDNGLGIVSHDGAGVAGAVRIPAGVVAGSGGNLISDNGLGLISDNGLGLISDNGLGIIANNGGGLVGNHAAGLTGKAKWALAQAAAAAGLPLARATVVLCAADGTILRAPGGEPYVAKTDDAGAYRFATTPVGPNLVVRVLLPGPVGDMVALLPRAAPGQARTDVPVDATSTLVMRFVLETYVAGQPQPQAVLDRLPALEEAVTRERVGQAGEAALRDFRAARVTTAMGALRAASPALDQQLEHVRRLLLVGQSNMGDGELATRVALNLPADLAYDPQGRLAIADRLNSRVRLVEKDGTIRTIVGTGEAGFSGDGGPGTRAAIQGPEAIAYDGAGNLYIADGGNRRVRRLRPDGTIETVAGNGLQKVDFAPYVEGPGPTVPLGRPGALAWDEGRRRLYVADTEGHAIWALEADGRLVLVAGDPRANRPPLPTRAVGYQVISPQGLALDGQGNLWIAQKSTPTLRKIDAAGIIHDVPLTGADSQLEGASGLALGKDGAFYLADTANHRVVRITPEGALTTVVGRHETPGPGDDGPAAEVFLLRPEGVAFDPEGRLVVADSVHGQIRRVGPDGRVLTIAGLPAGAQRGAIANELALNRPIDAVLDPSGALLIADTLNAVVRRRAPDGTLSILAGNGIKFSAGDGQPATAASFAGVGGLAYDPQGRLHVIDADSGTIRRIGTDGIVATVARGLSGAGALAFDAKGDVYVVMPERCLIVKVPLSQGLADPSAEPVAGTTDAAGSRGDGGPAAAAGLNLPTGMVIDARGDLYVTETRGQRIRKIALGEPGRPISTVLVSDAMAPAAGDPSDAPRAGFAAPNNLILDAQGRFLVSDFVRNAVLRVARDGTTEVIAGDGGRAFTGAGVDDGLKQPAGLAFDRDGGLFVVDSGNNQVKRVPPAQLE